MSVRSPYTETETEFDLSDDHHEVDLEKIITPRGERLIITSPAFESSISVDALDLESLTFQDADTLVDIARESGTEAGAEAILSRLAPAEDDAAEASVSVRISNEFTQVTVSKFDSLDGEYVEVTSEKLGYSNRLSVGILAALTEREPDIFSEFLHEPWGPDQAHHH